MKVDHKASPNDVAVNMKRPDDGKGAVSLGLLRVVWVLILSGSNNNVFGDFGKR